MKRSFVVAAIALGALACTTRSSVSTAPPVHETTIAPPANTVPSREQRMVARMLKRVEEVRGLSASRPVPAVVLRRAELLARVKGHLKREVPSDAIRNEARVLQLLGLIPTHFDYEAATYKLLEAQLAGYYEPADGTMYLASDLGDEGAMATLAHELVHALQDQRWNLEPHSHYTRGQGDRMAAFSALAEGDATSAMADVLVKAADPAKTALDLPEELLAEQMLTGMMGDKQASIPHVMKTSLVAPYIEGMRFVHALRRRGGWLAVNAAWNDLPTSTEQVLHPDKWDEHEPPAVVEALRVRGFDARFEAADEDTYGELGLREIFEEWVGHAKAAALAAHWGGDRGVLVASGDRYAFGLRIAYDVDVDDRSKAQGARTAFTQLTRALQERLGRPALQEPSRFWCVERATLGPLALAQRRDELLLFAGPARAQAPRWTSAGSCSALRAWARDG